MKAALALLLALALVRPLAVAQDSYTPPPELAAGSAAPLPPQSAPLDGRLYWARFDAEREADQAARAEHRARLDSVDVKTPRIVTLSLLVPAAGLLITAGVKAIMELSSVETTDGPFANDAYAEHDRFVNRCLAGAGGVLAMGAIGAGVWWGRRRAERNRLKQQLNSLSNKATLHLPSFALQPRTGGVGLLMRGRF